MKYLTRLMDFLVPRYAIEGKTQLIICIGCTGGKHRSVAIAEELGAHLREQKYDTLHVIHRDCRL